MLPSTDTRLLHEIWWRHCEKAGYPSWRGQKFPRWRVDLVEEYDIAWKSYSDTKKREILESINDSHPS